MVKEQASNDHCQDVCFRSNKKFECTQLFRNNYNALPQERKIKYQRPSFLFRFRVQLDENMLGKTIPRTAGTESVLFMNPNQSTGFVNSTDT